MRIYCSEGTCSIMVTAASEGAKVGVATVRAAGAAECFLF